MKTGFTGIIFISNRKTKSNRMTLNSKNINKSKIALFTTYQIDKRLKNMIKDPCCRPYERAGIFVYCTVVFEVAMCTAFSGSDLSVSI